MDRTVCELEEAVVDAWPAEDTHELDGWLLRASPGPTRRGNSVATLALHSTKPLEACIDEVEQWYAARGRSAVFQIGPCARPKELDALLERRGYAESPKAACAMAAAFRVSALAGAVDLDARVESKLPAAWSDVQARAGRFADDLPGLRGFLRRLGSRCRYVTAFDANGEPLACGLGIASEARLGVYAMLTLPAARRKGAARALLRALGKSALEDGMRELYLLVDLDNAPARALYQSAGFQDVYTYYYRTGPQR